MALAVLVRSNEEIGSRGIKGAYTRYTKGQGQPRATIDLMSYVQFVGDGTIPGARLVEELRRGTKPQTVNLLKVFYVGSNPASPTCCRLKRRESRRKPRRANRAKLFLFLAVPCSAIFSYAF